MENNCIASTEDKSLNAPVVLSWNELYSADFTFNAPFRLQLSDGQLLLAERVVRMIPKRRMVAFGMWQGKHVVAKLFFDPNHAVRHVEKEMKGIKLLHTNKIPTPTLYGEIESRDRRIHVLIFERIMDAKNLEEIWRDKEDIDEMMPLLEALVIELATQHVLGVQQQDLHLKNFLYNGKTIYTLDGAQIKLYPELLPKEISMNCLALFLSQLGVGVEDQQQVLFRHYAKSRSWLIKHEDVEALFLLIGKWNKRRWLRYEKKILRDSSNYASIKDWHTHGIYDRQYATPALIELLHNPDYAFHLPSAKILKSGGSSSVVKITLEGKDYVVKRYNIKSYFHLLRRCMRSTRAFKSWRLAQKLNLFGIPTAKPVAFIEKRFLYFRGKSYYMTEYVSDENAGDYFDYYRRDQYRLLEMVKRISVLLKNISKLAITHGDLKITNLLIDEKEQPVLIDLDGSTEHATVSGLHYAWKKELKRFMENFYENPSLAECFRGELGTKE